MTEQLLQRYFTNQITPHEARQVLDWFDTDEGRAYLLHRLDTQLGKADWHAPPNTLLPDAERMFNAIRERIVTDIPVVPLPAVRQTNWWAQSMRWAAVFVGALLLATAAFFGYRYLNPKDLIQQTAFGKISSLTLPDGSTVTLNGNSRLRYAPQWISRQTREVWLEGEGFFRVTHLRNHERFVVHLPNKLNIEVLGTQFNVMARPSRTRIVLSSGHIRLANSTGQQLDMKPGELIETNGQTKQVSRRRVDPAIDASWQTNRLIFDNTSLADIVQRLQDTYGLEVIVSDKSLLAQRFSGSVPNNNVDVLTDGLAKLFGLNIRRHSNQILINPIN